ncbi:hypothetical protein [Pandoravirus japonicus]|uniref:Uncharacterized protein n=1 Tax=Pandoravirus japonicus TaxID=2823154 RepID=A0A811BQC1_9VIRU|nr:hypothetical protein [Pandoravirus japonicus]
MTKSSLHLAQPRSHCDCARIVRVLFALAPLFLDGLRPAQTGWLDPWPQPHRLGVARHLFRLLCGLFLSFLG